MVSLTFHDEHAAWQQRVNKEITQAHRFQCNQVDSFKKSLSPVKRYNGSRSKHRAFSNVYSSLPAANINLGTMNVYAEVRGKYARNANNTINNAVQSSGIVSRPTTSGSLKGYTHRNYFKEEPDKKEIKPEEDPKNHRPLNNESKTVIKKRRIYDANIEKIKPEEDRLIIENRSNLDDENNKENENELNQKDQGSEVNNTDEAGSENEDTILDENLHEDPDKKTEVSFKTTSSQQRYIEELERLLKEERLKRIYAEDKLQRLSTSHSKKRNN
ncbi:hypothetical protein SteCoe_35220 [Stentor coeruleus]|uniref:Uncharacterized protein n=1 Tax=Stentor coeruleus TaxID=5963 RepID=A0A1R2AST8_9CILI|nr:hypothetical protein SteCoe_35220 [Stentor coeruleus]